MTDAQIKDKIHTIMQKLHDPKMGIKGYQNDLIAQNLSRDEYISALYAKGAEMVKKYGLEHASPDEQKFRVTGKDIIENRFYASCGNAAKAFAYWAKKEGLGVLFLISTDTEHLIDGMEGHTLPMVKFSDGWHAIEPQLPPTEEYILKDEIKIGGMINHILPGIQGKGRPYKILHVMTPDFYEEHLSSHKVAMEYFVERDEHTQSIIDKMQSGLNQMTGVRKKSPAQLIYEFSQVVPDKKLPIDVVEVGGGNTQYIFIRVRLKGQDYAAHLDREDLRVSRLDRILKNDNMVITKEMSLSDFQTDYQLTMLEKTKSGVEK